MPPIATTEKVSGRQRLAQITLLAAVLMTSGCATQFIRAQHDVSSDMPIFGPDVKFALDAGRWERSDRCVTVLPVEAEVLQDRNQVSSVRQAVRSRLLAKGYVLATERVPDIVQAGCGLALSVRMNTLDKRFFGLFSEVRAGADMRLTITGTGQEVWSSTHRVALRGGGLPTGPLSTLLGVYSAAENATDEQVDRALEELVRKMLATLPDATNTASTENLRRARLTRTYKGSVDDWLGQLSALDREQALVELIDNAGLAPDEKEAAFIRLLAIADKPHYRRERIRLRLARSQTAAAIDEANDLTRREPEDAKNWLLLADANMQDRSWDAAGKALLHAAKLRPSDANVFEKIGYVADKTGRQDRAKASFLKALELDPQSKYANFQLALAYMKSGDTELASEHLVTAGKAFLAAGDMRKAEQVRDYLDELAVKEGSEAIVMTARNYASLVRQ